MFPEVGKFFLLPGCPLDFPVTVHFALDTAGANVLFSFPMSQDPPEDDGQLHTLGLLEELRRECSLHWSTSPDLYRKIDSVLRKLANPNLHDITNMSFRVEL
jgi:hypothetical protein